MSWYVLPLANFLLYFVDREILGEDRKERQKEKVHSTFSMSGRPITLI